VVCSGCGHLRPVFFFFHDVDPGNGADVFETFAGPYRTIRRYVGGDGIV
jgi:hypothetical protein